MQEKCPLLKSIRHKKKTFAWRRGSINRIFMITMSRYYVQKSSWHPRRKWGASHHAIACISPRGFSLDDAMANVGGSRQETFRSSLSTFKLSSSSEMGLS
ncbi:hypothetical protein NPIL_679401 [Nephila pilipes]|uniref:Uncharacterized protein n=1 Tax=Nephila pilipes TaxID=299642 RepID=A0A8X6NL78_NEPPI|nr:hypothetical protein NPIL_679401 [Nephila pilipes]